MPDRSGVTHTPPVGISHPSPGTVVETPTGARGRRCAVFIVLAAIALAAVWQLLIPPVVGIADNGDFPRIMSKFNLGYTTDDPDDRYFRYFVPTYRFSPANHWASGFYSTEVVLVAASLPLNSLISKDGLYDLRVLGILHLAFLLLALWLLLDALSTLSSTAFYGSCGLVGLCFTDVTYIAYFNSFYSESASVLSLLFCVALGARLATSRGNPRRNHAFLLAAAVALILAKPQNALLGPLLVVPMALMWSVTRTRGWRWACGVSCGVTLVAALVSFQLAPQYLTRFTLHSSVFLELLPNSLTPERDLDELGLDRKLLVYSRTTPYAIDSPARQAWFQSDFFDRMSLGKIVAFYARHPRRFAAVLDRVGRRALHGRPDAHGNFEKKAGLPPREQSRAFSWWNRARESFGPTSLAGLAGWYGACLVAASLLRYRTAAPGLKTLASGVVFLVGVSVLQILVVASAQGTIDNARHLILACTAFDLLVVAAAAGLAHLLTLGWRSWYLARDIPR